MADTPKPGTHTQSPAVNGGEGTVVWIDPERVNELAKLVEKQYNDYIAIRGEEALLSTSPEEILADEQGALAVKARELGMEKEFQEFKSKLPKIEELNKEVIATLQGSRNQENRSSPAGQAKDEEKSGSLKGKSYAGGFLGAVLGGAASGFAAFKWMQRGLVAKSVATAAGALVAGAAGSMVAVMTSKQVKEARKISYQAEGLTVDALTPLLEAMAGRMGQLEQGQSCVSEEMQQTNAGMDGRVPEPDASQKHYAASELPPAGSRQEALRAQETRGQNLAMSRG